MNRQEQALADFFFSDGKRSVQIGPIGQGRSIKVSDGKVLIGPNVITPSTDLTELKDRVLSLCFRFDTVSEERRLSSIRSTKKDLKAALINLHRLLGADETLDFTSKIMNKLEN